MNSVVANSEPDDVRGHILNCAEERFRTFGYGKTTMAEIASDAGMSAANLYRYFVNKQDLGSACADRCMEALYTTLRNVVRAPGLSAGECLEQLVIAMVRWTHGHASEQPRIRELVEMIAQERREIVHRGDMRVDALLAEVLSRGNDTGEFEIEDVIREAQTVHAAVRMFEVPIFMGFYDQEMFETVGSDVVRLLLRGLRKR